MEQNFLLKDVTRDGADDYISYGSTMTVYPGVGDGTFGAPACHFIYFYGTRTLNMINDAETALVAPFNILARTNATLSNSRCALDLTRVTETQEPGRIVVNFGSVIYQPANFSGAKSLYVVAFDAAGNATHWLEAFKLNIP